MKTINMLLLALGIVLSVSQTRADEIERTTYIDPVTGERTTRIVRETTRLSVPVVQRIVQPLGYGVPMPRFVPIEEASSHGEFPLNPRDGDKVRVNGVRYEWDADDQRWDRD